MRSAGRPISGILSISPAAVLVTALPATPGRAAPRPAGRNARTGAATNLTDTPPRVRLRPALSRGATGRPLGVPGVPSSWH